MIMSTAMCVIALSAASLDQKLPQAERDYATTAVADSILALDEKQFSTYQEERSALFMLMRRDPSIMLVIRDAAYEPCVEQARARDKADSK